jgi:hypothetical protein
MEGRSKKSHVDPAPPLLTNRSEKWDGVHNEHSIDIPHRNRKRICRV